MPTTWSPFPHHHIINQLYMYLRLSTMVEPDLELSPSERVFVDPMTGGSIPFPRASSSPPSLYISLVVPAYKEEKRCKIFPLPPRPS